MCLFREGDKDWLCLIQIRNVLMTNVSQQELRGWTSRCEESLLSILALPLHMPGRRPETFEHDCEFLSMMLNGC